MHKGTIAQIIGPVVDVEFEERKLPKIFEALIAARAAEDRVTPEVTKHIGGARTRAIALSSTDGLVRGMEVAATGEEISVPVGKETLGRIFNVLGAPIDRKDSNSFPKR